MGFRLSCTRKLDDTDKQIDPLIASLHLGSDGLRPYTTLIEERLTRPGVFVMVHGERHRPLPPFEMRDHPLHPPHDLHRQLDVALSVMLLDVQPKVHLLPGGEVSLFPRPTTLGASFYLYLVTMAVLGMLLIIVAAFVGRALTLRSFAPLHDVSKALAQLADGDFSASLVRVSNDSDMRDLAANYNRAVLRVAQAIAEQQRNEQRMRQFIADASHELRTPLTVILGYFDALRKPTENHAQQFERAFPVISAEGQRMRKLIDNMSLLARLDQDGVSRLEIIDLTELVREVLVVLSIIPDGHRLVVEAAAPVLITGNRDELFAAVRNLAENALKYAPNGRVVMRTSHENTEAIVEVSDEGPGIDPHDLPHLFKRFYRGEQGGNISGSGLGLPIVARAVERAHGSIRVLTCEPQGTRFRLAFPPCAFQEDANAGNSS